MTVRVVNPGVMGQDALGDPSGWNQTLQDTTVLANLSPATGDASTILVKRMLNEAGWTTLHSSDATTFSNNSDVIGTSASALAHLNAYFDLNSPDGKRSFIFRRGANSRTFEFRLTLHGWNADGTATVPPTPVDGTVVFLTGNATAGGAQQFWPADTTYWFSSAVQTVAPYAWYMFTIFTTPVTVQAIQPEAGILVDPLFFNVSPNDPDPCIYNWCASANTSEFLALTHTSAAAGGLFTEDVNNTGGGPRGFIGRGFSGGAFSAIPPLTYAGSSGGSMYPNNGAVDLANDEDLPIPVAWGRSPVITTSPGAPYGHKGFSNVLKYPGQFGPTGSQRDYGTPGAKDGIIVNVMVLPWPSKVLLNRP